MAHLMIVIMHGQRATFAAFSARPETWMLLHTTSPNRPQANGMVESAVKTANTLRTTEYSGGDAGLDPVDGYAQKCSVTKNGYCPVQRMFKKNVDMCVGLCRSSTAGNNNRVNQMRKKKEKKIDRATTQYYNSAPTPLQDLAMPPGQLDRMYGLHPATVGEKENGAGHIRKKPGEEPRLYDRLAGDSKEKQR